MSEPQRGVGAKVILERGDFDALLDALRVRYPRLLGPTVAEGTLVYDRIETSSDLPVGVTDRQEAGSHRLVESDRPTLFSYVVGQQSWKQFLLPPHELLWRAERSGKGFRVVDEPPAPEPQAFVGVRPCEIAALKIHDTVLADGPYADPHYVSRRRNTFVLAANCVEPGGTCFCVSMGTGPQATGGFDLALTEVCDDRGHHFVVETGTEHGAEVLADVPHRPADDARLETAAQLLGTARKRMGRRLDTKGLKELLRDRFDSPRWEETARRCLACANCTMVCPTCFCTTTSDTIDLAGDRAERHRRWDSCFTIDFSYIHGGSVRTSGAARYRQWLTHKLGHWHDQFGTSGCVGCGRCITWCPAGIDITEEAEALREEAETAAAD